MRRMFVFGVFCLVLAAVPATPQSGSGANHVLLSAAELKWGPAPPALPSGSMVALLSGDPAQPGPFAIRTKMPAGYRIPPHWHPVVEHLTILSGDVALGMGDTFDESTMTTLGPGGYAALPPEMRHYLKARTDVVMEVHGVGPFVLTYVNPADDPRAKATAK